MPISVRITKGKKTPLSGDGTWSNQIQGSEKRTLAGVWIGAVFLTVTPLLFFWHMHAFVLRPGIPNPILCVVMLVGLLLFIRAIWETIRFKRFGDPILDLVQVPVPLGGKVEGRIGFGSNHTTAPEFTLKLQCLRVITQSSGKNTRTTENVLWSSESTTSLLPGGLVPVDLAVPGDQLETNSEDPWNKILWRLTVTAPFRGIKFLEKYEIPVEGRMAGSGPESQTPSPLDATPATAKKLFLATLPFLIVGCAILIFGLYLLTFGIADIVKAQASTSWPVVSGHVIASTPPYGSAIFANPHVAYSYDVNGSPDLSGMTIYPHLFWKRTLALQMARDFPAGATVSVHYSSAHPSDACLIPGLRPGVFQRLVLALIALAAGFMFASSALLAPKYGVLTGNTITYREGSPGSRIFGSTFLFISVLGVVLWFIS